MSRFFLRPEEDEKLVGNSITKDIMEQEIDRLKEFKSPLPNEIYPRVLK